MNKKIPILLGLLLMIIAVWLQITSVEAVRSFIQRVDSMAYDMQLRAKILAQQKHITDSVVIIDIDDKSLKVEGRWPWPRSKVALLIDRLQEEGVAVIAMDMMFSEKEIDITDTLLTELTKQQLNTPALTQTLNTIKPTFDNDATFSKSLARQDMVLGLTFLPRDQTSGVLPAPTFILNTPAEKELNFIQNKGYIGNIPIIQSAAKQAGFINVFADQDGIIRRVPLLMRYNDSLYSSLAFQAVQLYLFTKPSMNTAIYNDKSRLESVQIGDYAIPTDASGQVLVPFRGKSFTFSYFSATDILHHQIAANTLAGKIVFIGTSASGLGDIQATAIQGSFPGVEVQATIADGILQKNFPYKPAWTKGAEISFTLALGLILSILFPFLGPRILSLLIIALPVIFIFLNNWIAEKTGLIIFILTPLLLIVALAILNMVYGYLFETRKREELKGMFGQYVPSKHIDEMLKKGGHEFALSGEDRNMTVLFADIRNFTTISEPMSAAELKDMLNLFFTPMTETIFNYQGTIDKYIGDLIMAFWGAPLVDEEHATHALSAAVDMQKRVDELKVSFAAKGLPLIEIGIGLNSGEMSVGDMGSQFRKNYTVLGDAVNLGSRVEGLTKFYGVKTMVSQSTQHNQPLFVFRKLDHVRVKGKKLGISIYELVGRRSEVAESMIEEIQLSEKALNLYFEMKWDQAHAQFSKLKTTYPDVKLYSLYLKRIADFKINPPPQDWDGVYEHSSK